VRHFRSFTSNSLAVGARACTVFVVLLMCAHVPVEGSRAEEDLSEATLVRRALDHMRSDEYACAVVEWTQTLVLNPRLPLAYSNRGLAYAKLEQYDQAISDFTRALELETNNPDTYLKRANAFFDRGSYREAVEDYSRAIDRDPTLFRAYYNRCDARERVGEKDLALRDCMRALELEPSFDPARKAVDWLSHGAQGERPCFCNF
jgi:tetratricopeptide (TPR) repeat protein